MTDHQLDPIEEITAANVSCDILNEHVAGSLLMAWRLLEFLLLDDLPAAKAYHERRIAPILDQGVAQLTQLEEHHKSAQARATILRGVPGHGG